MKALVVQKEKKKKQKKIQQRGTMAKIHDITLFSLKRRNYCNERKTSLNELHLYVDSNKLTEKK